MLLWELFLSFFKVGLFSFGGGYAAMPLIQHQVIEAHQWLSMAEFSDLIAISQMTPGPIAVNAATFIGLQLAGFWGAIVATLGCIFPSCIFVSLLALLYKHYKAVPAIQGALAALRPAILALVLTAGLSIFALAVWGTLGASCNLKQIDFIALLLFALAMILLRKAKLNPFLLMVIIGVVGSLAYLWADKIRPH